MKAGAPMNGSVLLSIVIPSFDMEKCLAACCDSLLVGEGWLRRLEVLVVNDGSADRTGEIARGYQERFPGTFRVIDKENGHYGSCVNRGLREARGAYVKILDADDTFDTSNLQSLLQAMDSWRDGEGPDLVVSDVLEVGPDGAGKTVSRAALRPLAVLPAGAMEAARFETRMHALAYRTGVLGETGYRQTEGICYTDTEWAIKPLMGVRTVFYFPRVVYRYQVGREGQSVDARVLRKNFWMLDKVVRTIVAFYREEVAPRETAASSYVRFRVGRLLAMYYEHVLFFTDKEQIDAFLPAFDDYLWAVSPGLYRSLDRETKPRRRGFRYIAFWRRRKEAGPLYLFGLHLYSRLASFLMSLAPKGRL